jgi:hypothetical protein
MRVETDTQQAVSWPHLNDSSRAFANPMAPGAFQEMTTIAA